MSEEKGSFLSPVQSARAEALTVSRAVLAASNVFGKSQINDVEALIKVADWVLGDPQERVVLQPDTSPTFEDFLRSLVEGSIPAGVVPMNMGPEMLGFDVTDLFQSLMQTGKCADPACVKCNDEAEPGVSDGPQDVAEDEYEGDEGDPIFEGDSTYRPADDRTEPIPVVEDVDESDESRPIPVGDWKPVDEPDDRPVRRLP